MLWLVQLQLYSYREKASQSQPWTEVAVTAVSAVFGAFNRRLPTVPWEKAYGKVFLPRKRVCALVGKIELWNMQMKSSYYTSHKYTTSTWTSEPVPVSNTTCSHTGPVMVMPCCQRSLLKWNLPGEILWSKPMHFRTANAAPKPQ